MTTWLPIIQWAVNFGVLAVVGIAKWGMSQRELANQSVVTALTDRIVALETGRQEKEKMCSKHISDINDFRNRTEQMEGYMKRTSEDFVLALKQIEKLADRINSISDNMLRKSDLQFFNKPN
jgi:type VI protein secretion system component VasK